MYHKRSQNWNFKTAKSHKQLQKLIIETHPPPRPAKRLCLKGVKPLKLMTATHFHMFFQKPSAHKGGKTAPEIEPQGAPNQKKQQPRALKKTAQTKTAKIKLLQRF